MLELRQCKRINCRKFFTVNNRQKGKRYCSLSCRNSEFQLRLTHRKRNKILKLLGKKCIKCGFSDRRALQIDHVNGDGCKERKKKGMSCRRVYYNRIIKEIESGSKKYQLLCANCNWIKRAKNKEHT